MTSAEPPPSGAFFTADHVDAAPEAVLETTANIDLDPNSTAFSDFFEISKITAWIREHSFTRVALQLPDDFLRYTVPLVTQLEDALEGVKTFILADTSYRSCCVDAVAAEHARCDALVHFGEACLSAPTNDIPVLFVFGKLSVDLSNFEAELAEVKDKIDLGLEMVLLFEPGYSGVSESLSSTVSKTYPEIKLTVCQMGQNSPSEVTSLGRVLPSGWDATQSATLLFIGNASSALLPIWQLTHPRFIQVIHYSPFEKTIAVDSPQSMRGLRKRLFLIEKLRDANVVGLVVGTLGVGQVREAIARIRELCKVAQKKLYVLSIGKVNEAKLSNFANDIDAFILLSCPFGIFLDAGQFFKPVVSLFEAEIALNPCKDWYAAGGWTAQFAEFVNDKIGEQDFDAVDVSLISGRIRATNITEDQTGPDGDAAKQLLEYGASNYFANRTWKGLDNTYIEEDMTLNDGLKGVAMEYKSEPPKPEGSNC
uniref:2-(3-amino-3-carboxypropyl)histidine synthase subunit 2 n=1 Tax=Panagrellus redivivus TaxID=6233 RepID=A0A7E4VTG7_PANRE